MSSHIQKHDQRSYKIVELKQTCGIPACNAAAVEPLFSQGDIFIQKKVQHLSVLVYLYILDH